MKILQNHAVSRQEKIDAIKYSHPKFERMLNIVDLHFAS